MSRHQFRAPRDSAPMTSGRRSPRRQRAAVRVVGACRAALSSSRLFVPLAQLERRAGTPRRGLRARAIALFACCRVLADAGASRNAALTGHIAARACADEGLEPLLVLGATARLAAPRVLPVPRRGRLCGRATTSTSCEFACSLGAGARLGGGGGAAARRRRDAEGARLVVRRLAAPAARGREPRQPRARGREKREVRAALGLWLLYTRCCRVPVK